MNKCLFFRYLLLFLSAAQAFFQQQLILRHHHHHHHHQQHYHSSPRQPAGSSSPAQPILPEFLRMSANGQQQGNNNNQNSTLLLGRTDDIISSSNNKEESLENCVDTVLSLQHNAPESVRLLLQQQHQYDSSNGDSVVASTTANGDDGNMWNGGFTDSSTTTTETTGAMSSLQTTIPDPTLPLPINSLVFQVVRTGGGGGGDWQTESDACYVLAVLSSSDRVNRQALEQAVSRELFNQRRMGSSSSSNDQRRVELKLAASSRVEALCGFPPGCVPPLGLIPKPLLTLVEESLLLLQQQQQDVMLLGGGGPLGQSCLVRLEALLKCDESSNPVRVASFRQEKPTTTITTMNDIEEDATTTFHPPSPVAIQMKPYFAVAPPDNSIHQRPVAFSVVGRLSQVRRMARTLVFADLAPPTITTATTPDNNDDDDNNNNNNSNIDPLPWRCGLTGQDMAVQLILGKTYCQNFQNDDDNAAVAAIEALRSIKVGQLVLATGVTNSQNKASLKNWTKKQTLDLIVSTLQVLQEDDPDAAWRPLPRPRQNSQQEDIDDYNGINNVSAIRSSNSVWAAAAAAGTTLLHPHHPHLRSRSSSSSSSSSRPPSFSEPGMSYLSVNQLYGPPPARSSAEHDEDDDDEMESPLPSSSSSSSYVTIVDNLEAVHDFSNQLSQLLLQLTTSKAHQQDEPNDPSTSTSTFPIGLVGMDCEWRPNFLLQDRNEPQPVLLLQICLHSLKKVYLFDLQTLLRPLLTASEPMNDVETVVSLVLGDLWLSTRLIKVGFQLVDDLRRLAASYPHIPSFQIVHAVMEASRLGKKVMHLTKRPNARIATSSLARLTERFVGKTINKEQQCSDWSVRPLSDKQIEYAALDAVVTPVITEILIQKINVTFFESPPQLGRWKDDSSFREAIVSCRFLFLETTDASRSALRKLNARRIIGNPYIVTQIWTGKESPRLPSMPSHGGQGPYTDASGILRIPSQMTRIVHACKDDSSTSTFDRHLDAMIGEQIGRGKDGCVNRFLTGKAALPEGSVLDFPQRSGYVEFEDAVALFVNAPSKPGDGGQTNPRSYPNEWLQDGRVMTWFLRESEWKQGTSRLARKLLPNSTSDKIPPVVLFVRSGKGFLCCGRCRVNPEEEVEQEHDSNSQSSTPSRDWDLVQLNLELLDWEGLHLCDAFQELVIPFASLDNVDSPKASGD